MKNAKLSSIKLEKKFDATLEEAYKRLELFSHNPKTSCYQRNKTIIPQGGYDVSVIVPVYNTASYLKRCIDSIVDQNSGYRVQCIIINDGSSDEFWKNTFRLINICDGSNSG